MITLKNLGDIPLSAPVCTPLWHSRALKFNIMRRRVKKSNPSYKYNHSKPKKVFELKYPSKFPHNNLNYSVYVEIKVEGSY